MGSVKGCFSIAKKEVIKMRDRLEPCIYYVCKDADCKKGFVKVDMKKCKNCPKYQPRKSSQKKESVKDKRQKEEKSINGKKEFIL